MEKMLCYLGILVGCSMVVYPSRWRWVYVNFGNPSFLRRYYARWSDNVYRFTGASFAAVFIFLLIDLLHKQGH